MYILSLVQTLLLLFYSFVLLPEVVDRYESKAIEYGYAIHHPKTGSFTWKAELKE